MLIDGVKWPLVKDLTEEYKKGAQVVVLREVLF